MYREREKLGVETYPLHRDKEETEEDEGREVFIFKRIAPRRTSAERETAPL